MSRDQRAAQDMVRLSGQSGVPVTVAGSDVIVGFDQRRLEQVASRVGAAAADRPRLGMQIRDAGGGGAEVGPVRAGSPAERAGLQPGDVIVQVAQQPIASASNVEGLVARLGASATIDIVVIRGSSRLGLRILPQP